MSDVKVDDYFAGKVIRTVVKEGQKVIIKTEDGSRLTIVPSFDIVVDVPDA